MVDMFFSGWQPLVRIVMVGTLAYISLVAVLRMTGKRTLSKLNAFDLVITVSLGSCLATVLLSKDIALSEGIVAFGTLCGLQYCVTWLSVRSRRIRKFVKSEPSVLLLRGKPIDSVLRAERITMDELQSALRAAHHYDLQTADAIILETDGSLTVIEFNGSVTAGELISVPPKTQTGRQ